MTAKNIAAVIKKPMCLKRMSPPREQRTLLWLKWKQEKRLKQGFHSFLFQLLAGCTKCFAEWKEFLAFTTATSSPCRAHRGLYMWLSRIWDTVQDVGQTHRERDKSEISHQGGTYLIQSNNVLLAFLCIISLLVSPCSLFQTRCVIPGGFDIRFFLAAEKKFKSVITSWKWFEKMLIWYLFWVFVIHFIGFLCVCVCVCVCVFFFFFNLHLWEIR